MANALKQLDRDDLTSTILFIEKMNKAFDILNVRHKGEGRQNQAPNRAPILSTEDDRLKVVVITASQNTYRQWLVN